MPQRALNLCLLTLLGLLLTAGLTPASAGPLIIIADGGTTALDQTQPPTASYEFGIRKPTDDSPLTHTFLLHNSGTAPVIVAKLEAACGCTSAVLGDAQTLPATVKPNQNIAIVVSIDPHRLGPGSVQKSVWVYTADDLAQPAVLLEMFGEIQSVPSPSPETAPLPGQPLPSVLPQTGHLAPPFTRPDTTGKPFALTAARGRPLALFFFCGCPWCADVAQAWGRVQRGAHLPDAARTVVVFAGDKAAASAFAAKNGLDFTQTLLLPDPDSKLTETVYHANSCPRTFVVNPQGIITYTNDHPDDLPRQAPAKTIVIHAFEALGQTQTGQLRDRRE